MKEKCMYPHEHVRPLARLQILIISCVSTKLRLVSADLPRVSSSKSRSPVEELGCVQIKARAGPDQYLYPVSISYSSV